MAEKQDFDSSFVAKDGRFQGAYVYFVCCAGDLPEIVYIKIGYSCQPTARIAAVLSGCGLRPLSFATCNVRTKRVARKLEGQLHKAFAANRTTGEWFRFSKEEKQIFQDTREKLIAPLRSYAWPMDICMGNAKQFQQLLIDRRQDYRRRVKSLGSAFMDFARDFRQTSSQS